MVGINNEHAIAFLSWLFGTNPAGNIYYLAHKLSNERLERERGVQVLRPKTIKTPAKLLTLWWEEHAAEYNITYSTALIDSPDSKNQGTNTLSVPALWVDIDGCKRLGIPGEEFWAELKGVVDISCWVRSSENGIQGYFKLAEPYEANGDRERFAEELKPLLANIAYYFGGDFKVIKLGGLMRLPGTLNVKPEYEKTYQVTAHYNDSVYSLGDLAKRFPTNANIVPRIVAHAVCKALGEVWQQGQRHYLILHLAGTIRKQGINKEACLNLIHEVQKFFNDTDSRDANIATTYSSEIDNLETLRSEYGSIAIAVEEAIQFWVELKQEYCRILGREFTPENVNPLDGKSKNEPFFIKGNETWYRGTEEEELFANFVVQLKGRTIKTETHNSVWNAQILKSGERRPYNVDIDTASHYNPQTFSRIPGMPIGMLVKKRILWDAYIAWLDKQCPDIVHLETSYYGWMDTHTDKPTLFLPNEPHPIYVWTAENEDTADMGALDVRLSLPKIQKYLNHFMDYYADYHENRYIWSALGWFMACPVGAFIREVLDGFPTLVICGLSGSGKSQLIKDVLGRHFGAKTTSSFAGTTPYAIKRNLVSNNIIPFILDEFRVGDDKKAKDVQAIIRSLWDGSYVSFGIGNNKVHKDKFVAPMCVIGEHHYKDEASLHRTFSIRINREWVKKVSDWPQDKRGRLYQRQEWLHDSRYKGYMTHIILTWAQTHTDDIYECLEKARKKVEATCPAKVSRKQYGFMTVLTGLLILRCICNEYDVDFPLNMTQMLDALYHADTLIEDHRTYDTSTLKELFLYTDRAIMKAAAMNRRLCGYVYQLDADEPRKFAYFDYNRWVMELKDFIREDESATLLNRDAFVELIKDSVATPNSPFLGFPKDHPYFQHSCVKVDLEQVEKLYGINVNQWLQQSQEMEF